MKSKILIALMLLVIPLSGQKAGDQVQIRVTYGREVITVSSTAIGFTSSVINPTCTNCPINNLRATLATCRVETADIRIATNGTDPTATVGVLITSSSFFSVYGYTDIANFRMIRTGSDASVTCQYSRIP